MADVLLLDFNKDVRTLAAAQKHQLSTLEHLQFTIAYLDADKLMDDYSELKEVEKM